MTLRPDVLGITVDAQLFHEAGCRLVHKYRVYKDPFPHPALRGGVLPRLLSLVGRAMAIAQLTQLRISVPASGASLGQVPEECGTSSWVLTNPHRVSFTSDVTVLGGAPPQDNSPNIVLQDPPCPEIAEGDDMDPDGATEDITTTVVPPPPGFRQFSWPREEWSVGSEQSLLDFAKGLPGWFPWRYGEQPVDPPSLPLSPILQESLDDSVIANVGSSRDESSAPSETVVITQPVGDALRVETNYVAISESMSPDVAGVCSGLPLGLVVDSPQGITNRKSRRSLSGVPRWRPAWEGHFIAERSSSSLRSFGAVCGSD